MGLSIKNDEIERLVRDYAKQHGITMTDAIRKAIIQARANDRAEITTAAERRRREIDEIVDAFAKLPVVDPSVNADDWMYDENGLPH